MLLVHVNFNNLEHGNLFDNHMKRLSDNNYNWLHTSSQYKSEKVSEIFFDFNNGMLYSRVRNGEYESIHYEISQEEMKIINITQTYIKECY